MKPFILAGFSDRCGLLSLNQILCIFEADICLDPGYIYRYIGGPLGLLSTSALRSAIHQRREKGKLKYLMY